MKWYFYLLWLCTPYSLYGQGIFRLKENKPVTLKFELVNHVVLVPLTINGIAFSFLLDTGVKETILFAQAPDSVYLHNKNKVKFQGIGLDDGIEGILSKDNIVDVGGVAVDSLHWLFVIQAAALEISTDVGVAINGILGSRFFQSFVIRMDYLRKQMTLYPIGYDYAKDVRKFTPLPLEIVNERPYIMASINSHDKLVDGKFLLDMGNTDPLMLFSFLMPSFEVHRPFVEEYIGRGFNGEIHGKRNRVKAVTMGDYRLDYPIVAYPDANAVFMSKLSKGRIGSVGSQVLQRFDLLLDYRRGLLYLRKNKLFAKPFQLNMAGMDVKHDGMIWSKEIVKLPKRTKDPTAWHSENQGVRIEVGGNDLQYSFVLRDSYRVAGLRKDAPAAVAGVQVGDRLLTINGTSVGGLTLAKIMARLQSQEGDIVRLSLERDGAVKDVRFRLVDPVPYLK
ncbi:aspartyl protease family protein [Sphingobacterium oryzagri]|uniref:Aspartyl protease family protein n=1 Tax=Sphingobacterium oryzagri TaxID=3025669 RepID=A0ABY7WFA3_9SPHI|nr:PDZ domain-containing protein [Sphingobacterium sp. KACC 22765]WDF67152.1 aspartyl protease family protein [Sphingobacterium sp. KACC 22765]